MQPSMPDWTNPATWQQFWGGTPGFGGSHPGFAPFIDATTAGQADFNSALGRLGEASQRYFAMAEKASQLGRGATTTDVVAAMREWLAGFAGNPALEAMLGPLGMGGGSAFGAGGTDPVTATLVQTWRTLLSMPAFGLRREQQERWQQLGTAMLDHQQAFQRYAALMAVANERTLAILADKLAAREAPGKAVESLRGLFDLFIDAAEEAHAEVALSTEYRTAWGALTDAQMAVRAGLNGEVERLCDSMGIPTRTEIDSTHQRVHAQAREIRALRRRLDALEATPAPQAAKLSSKATAAAKPDSSKAAITGATKRASAKPVSKATKRPPAKQTSKAAITKATKRPSAKQTSKPANNTKATKRPSAKQTSKPTKATKSSRPRR